MRRSIIALAAAAALAVAPVMLGQDTAEAGGQDVLKGIIGGIIAGAVISSIVQAGQYHCHGNICHRHGYAGPYHYHDAYGTILYQAPAPTYVVPAPPPPVYVVPAPPTYVVPAPPPVYGGYSQAHYAWCAQRYRSYDARSNTFQPLGAVPRRPCISPYM